MAPRVRPCDWWKVGIATDPQPEDKRYSTLDSAMDRAEKMSAAHGFNTPVAIWDSQDVIVHLFLCGQVFSDE